MDDSIYSTSQHAIIEAILRSERVVEGRMVPCAWAVEWELGLRFGHEHVAAMTTDEPGREPDRPLVRWRPPHVSPMVTLTAWTAYNVGWRLSEWLVSWVEVVVDYRPSRRGLPHKVRVRIPHHDYEPFWVPSGQPERSLRLPSDEVARACDRDFVVEKPLSTGKWVADIDTGETTDDPGKAAVMTLGGRDTPVRVLGRPRGGSKKNKSGKSRKNS